MVTGRVDSSNFKKHIGMGMVSQIFTEEILTKMRGDLGIGHTRYSTAGTSSLVNCQPFEVETLQGKIAVAHNGELVNCKSLRQKVRIATECNKVQLFDFSQEIEKCVQL